MTQLIGLNFHGIGPPGHEIEPGEARYWLDRDLFAGILDRVARSPDPGRYVITFDDGNISDYTIALPALLERNLSGRFFVLTGRLGTEGFLDPGQLREMQAAGMTIGSHGIGHISWADLEPAILDEETSRSKAILEEILAHPVDEASIPFGRYDARVIRALRRARYSSAWSSDGGTLSPNAFLKARSSLRSDMTDREIDAILDGRLLLKRQFRRMRNRLKGHLPLFAR